MLRGILAGLTLSAIGFTGASAQELPNLREARNLVFAERGAIEWEVIPHEDLSPVDIATLNQLNQIQPQPYYGAMAIDPAAGLASERTSLAANYHDVDSASAAASDACGEGCVVVLVIRPEGWEPGRSLQLSTEAAAALRAEYRSLPRRSRAMAISDATGQWGVGEGRDAALAACGAEDCRIVVEG